jgi:hypothetical protein
MAVVWILQESTKRETGLTRLHTPCADFAVGKVEADRRAGRMLDFGQARGLDQAWRPYGLEMSQHYVRQVDTDLWQHLSEVPVVGA